MYDNTLCCLRFGTFSVGTVFKPQLLSLSAPVEEISMQVREVDSSQRQALFKVKRQNR